MDRSCGGKNEGKLNRRVRLVLQPPCKYCICLHWGEMPRLGEISSTLVTMTLHTLLALEIVTSLHWPPPHRLNMSADLPFLISDP